MPFVSRAQEKAAFGGYLGKEMQDKSKLWASETPNYRSLPEHKAPTPKKPRLRRVKYYGAKD